MQGRSTTPACLSDSVSIRLSVLAHASENSFSLIISRIFSQADAVLFSGGRETVRVESSERSCQIEDEGNGGEKARTKGSSWATDPSRAERSTMLAEHPGSGNWHERSTHLMMARWDRICAFLLDLYTSYLVLGVIVFSAKLGEDAEEMRLSVRWWMPASGHPNELLICEGRLGESSLLQCLWPYFSWNIPLAAVFLIQHSVLKTPLQRSFGSWGRRVYSFTSAVSLHFFMRNYKDCFSLFRQAHTGCQQ